MGRLDGARESPIKQPEADPVRARLAQDRLSRDDAQGLRLNVDVTFPARLEFGGLKPAAHHFPSFASRKTRAIFSV
jgi:hypothetical protein